MSTTMQVAKSLVALCREGKFDQAIADLYGDDIISIEAMSGPSMPAEIHGIEAVKGKSAWWAANHDVHGFEVSGPWPHGDMFIVRFTMDVTAKSGPMAGQRMKLDEAALYTVKDGKVVKEQFFYNMGA